jgi:hypothetical protein
MKLGSFKFNFPEFQHMRKKDAKYTLCICNNTQRVGTIKIFSQVGSSILNNFESINKISFFSDKTFGEFFCVQHTVSMIFLKLSNFYEFLWLLWNREENFGRIFCKSIKALTKF